jgi:hypothetical protein
MVQSRHYPFCHRKHAIWYPWSASYPATFSNFNSPSVVLGGVGVLVPPPAIRLGAAFLTDVTDMLTSAPDANERKVPKQGFGPLYFITDSTPAAISPWTITLGYVGIAFQAWVSTVVGNNAPNTRQDRRVFENRYVISASASSLIVASDGMGSQYTGSTSVTWQVSPTSLTSIISTVAAAIPTSYQSGDADYQTLTASYSSGTSATSNTAIGTVPINVGTYVDGLTSTLRTEIDAATVGATYRMAAIPAGVPSGTTNSTGTDSLEDWVPILY